MVDFSIKRCILKLGINFSLAQSKKFVEITALNIIIVQNEIIFLGSGESKNTF